MSAGDIHALLRDKHLQLYRDSKAKRLKKIKSKVYRALKKKHRTKEDQKKLEMLAEEDPDIFKKESEGQEKDRARERLTLRHRNKGKFSQQLRRYADQKDVQKLYIDLNRERKKVLRKMDMQDWAELASDQSDYAEAEFEAKAIADINKELESDEEHGEGETTDIVETLMRRGRENIKNEAEELLAAVKGEATKDRSNKPSKLLAEEGRVKITRSQQLLEEKG